MYEEAESEDSVFELVQPFANETRLGMFTSDSLTALSQINDGAGRRKDYLEETTIHWYMMEEGLEYIQR